MRNFGKIRMSTPPRIVFSRRWWPPFRLQPRMPGPVVPAAFRAVKVRTEGQGVVWVPRAALPGGFDPQRLSVYYEGRMTKVLGANREGVALWAPGSRAGPMKMVP